MNAYYDGYTRTREREIRNAVDSARVADEYRPSAGLRFRVGTGLIGLGRYLLKAGTPEGQLEHAA